MNTLTYVGLGLMGAGIVTKLVQPMRANQTADEQKTMGLVEIGLIGGGASLAFYAAFVQGRTPALTSGPPSSTYR